MVSLLLDRGANINCTGYEVALLNSGYSVARKAGNAVERRHASDRACSKMTGQAGEQEGADGSSKASVQRERKKNAPVDICDHGLEHFGPKTSVSITKVFHIAA